ncbi:hypothetical protein AB1J03_24390, partial [Vibrio diabolicus]|uniref:hypothetical protein n=1 Tax=Vibrio diabolicus TaxID=50719 RepID=UPI0034587966
KQRNRETEKQRNRETEKQRNRETEKQRNRETEKQRNRENEMSIGQMPKSRIKRCGFLKMAPPTGLEPVTCGLTVRRSTN